MNFKVGDIIQVKPEYQPSFGGQFKKWHIVILDRTTSLFTKTKYDILCVELGRIWIDKIGENGLTTNFHKTGHMTEEELKIARLLYLW